MQPGVMGTMAMKTNLSAMQMLDTQIKVIEQTLKQEC